MSRDAHALVALAVARGALARPDTCAHCGRTPQRRRRAVIVAHHPDYSKPLDVVWLCHRCHIAEHQRLVAAGNASVGWSRDYDPADAILPAR